jgi:DNA-binding MarR family transcriptional regulator
MGGSIADCRGAGVLALLHAAGAVETFIDARLAAVGLSLPRLAALDRLMRAGGSLPLGQLAERLACVKSNVTQLVDRLDADGLVTREPDPNDRRSRLAVITDAGRIAHEKGSAIHREAEEQLFGPLSPADAASLTSIIDKLNSARTSAEARNEDQRPDAVGASSRLV